MQVRISALAASVVAASFAVASPQVMATSVPWTSGEYRYDGAGNIVSIGAPGTPGYRTYGYDSASRLTRAHIGAAYGYEYDAYGNRTAYSLNQQRVTVPVLSTTNRFADAAYDAVGNQLARGSTSATYDGFGMMTSYRFDSANAETFVYTPGDERIGVLRNDEWTWSVRDGEGRVLRQYRSSATQPMTPWVWLEDFVYRGPLLLGAERAPADGGRQHYHLDHLGSPRLVTGASGSVIAEHDYLPFGEERTPIAQQQARGFSRESPHHFTGHERDFDSDTPDNTSASIDSMHARYYTAASGRFLSVDPSRESVQLGRPQTWDRYTYVENNPMVLTDPDGRYAVALGGAARLVGESLADVLAEQMLMQSVRAALVGTAFVLGMASEEAPDAEEGAPTGDEPPALLGAEGQQVDSKTLWSDDGMRVDVENPAPGRRAGQVHIQRGAGDDKETYTIQRYFDQRTKLWGYRLADKRGNGAPGWVKRLLQDAAVRDAIYKGMVRYLRENAFTMTRLHRW